MSAMSLRFPPHQGQVKTAADHAGSETIVFWRRLGYRNRSHRGAVFGNGELILAPAHIDSRCPPGLVSMLLRSFTHIDCRARGVVDWQTIERTTSIQHAGRNRRTDKKHGATPCCLDAESA
jgi:hypothetical protein